MTLLGICTQDGSFFQSRGVTLHSETTRVVEAFALLNSDDSAVHQNCNAWQISRRRRQKQRELHACSFRGTFKRGHKSSAFTNVQRATFLGVLGAGVVHPLVNHASLDGEPNGFPGFSGQFSSSIASPLPPSLIAR